ncbi:MAG: class I SAM-dependent methyltransferase [Nannocystaceae bacterium]|nr:class I SAM-dependent methyltransferase [Nannocystaceae bacterium]
MGLPAVDPSKALRHLYESFPYPRSVAGLDAFKSGQRQPIWNPKTSYSVFFPESKPRAELDILIAGCGTNLVPVFGAFMPQARIVGVDISGASLEISAQQCASNDITNVEHHQLALEDVASLGKSFDFVCCTGVLHHLEDPARGLSALGDVTRPEGAIMAMVYARYGRQGIYMLQELASMLGLRIDELSAAKTQKLLAQLPETHPFRLVYREVGQLISVEEVMDMILNPRDRSFRVHDVRDLVRDAGLGFHRWLGNAPYRPEMTALGQAGLLPEADVLDPWDQAAAAELAFGNIIKHSFVVTHPGRTTASDLFEGTALLGAYPSLSTHLKVEHSGADLIVTNEGHGVPIQTAAPVAEMAALLKACDGVRTVGQLASALGDGVVSAYRHLYNADAITLSTVSQATGTPPPH